MGTMDVTFDKKDDKDFNPFIVMSVPFPVDLIKDCYSAYAIDAPSEMKICILEQVAMAFDKYVIDNAPAYFSDKEWLKNKLNTVEIKYKV